MTQRPELVIGFVAPVGVQLRELIDRTTQFLGEFQYTPIEIRLSKLLERFSGWTSPVSSGEDVRIFHLQKLGHQFREQLADASALALAAVAAIREERARLTNNPDTPANSVAYLLNQLKHPKEVQLLRRIYGQSFVLIAAHATRSTRLAWISTAH